MPAMKGITIETIERQQKYVAQQKEKGKGLGIVFADAFLRGMRDLGYKNPAWALAEMIDNSLQAAAKTVSVQFGFLPGNTSEAKPDMVAVSDDGNGMIPEMISYAVRWGGTDREDDRQGWGRYGYGLPSAAVSTAKRYTVYSKTRQTGWHAVTVDIEELADAAGDLKRTEQLLMPKPAALPKWIVRKEDSIDLSQASSGTVVVLEDLDRLRRASGWIKTESLRTKLLQYFGVIYRHLIPDKKIIVNGVPTQVVDPLFIMEHGRFYDETPVRAVPVEARTFEVETPTGKKGTISIRASFLPANFQLINPSEYGRKGAKNNNRLPIMKDYNGLLICREWRHIDTISPRWTKFQNNDANVKIEINFDPSLDEYFGITTAKQQIVIDDEMWEKLQHSGKGGGSLVALVKDLRKRFDDSGVQLDAVAENRETAEEEVRPSIAAMEQSEKFKGISKVEPTPEQTEEANRNLEHAADERSVTTKKPKEQTFQELLVETSARKWQVDFAAVPEGPFYRPYRLGEQKRVIINTEHPFYTKMYQPASNDVRSAVEVLLFVLAERELDSVGDSETFYKAERQKWSERLRHALDTLVADQTMADKKSAIAEAMHIGTEVDNVAS
jgi:hypothetical protein